MNWPDPIERLSDKEPSPGSSAAGLPRFGGFWIDTGTEQLLGPNSQVRVLRPKSFRVLQILAARSGQLVTKQELMALVWPGVVVSDDSLVQCIADVRRALNDAGKKILVTVARKGYRLLADAPQVDEAHQTLAAGSFTSAESVLGRPGRTSGGRVGTTPVKAPPPLVGRTRELTSLVQAITPSRPPRAGFVLVSGESGIGKTRLVSEAMDRVAGATMHCAVSSAYALGTAIGYSTLIAWLKCPPIRENVRRLDAIWKQQIAALLPDALDPSLINERAGRDPARQNRLRLFNALSHAFRIGGNSTLLVLDNLQWCDGETLQWLNFALLQQPDAGLTVLATQRTGMKENPEVDRLLSNLTHADRITRIRLGSLTDAECERLADSVSVRWRQGIRSSELPRLTGGNPLFVIEAANRGRIGLQSGDDAGDRLREAVNARLDGLDDGARRLIEYAAALAGDFDVPLLQRITGIDGEAVCAALNALEQRQLIAPGPGRFAFRHDLLREVIYESLGHAGRQAIHATIAQALDAVAESDELYRGVVGGHFAQATHWARAGQWHRARQHYGESARQARADHAAHAEAQSLRAALDALEHEPVSRSGRRMRIELQLDLGLAYSAINGWGSESVRACWQDAYETAMQVGTVVQRARAINALDTYFRDAGQWHRCETLSAAALDLLPDIEDDYLRLCLMSSQAALLLHTGRPGRSLSAYAQVIATSNDDIVPSFNWFNNTFTIGAHFRSAQALWLLGRVDEAMRSAATALEQSVRRSDPFHRAITLFHVTMLYEFSRDVDRIRLYAGMLAELAAEFGFTFYQGSARLFDAFSRLQSGPDPEALQTVVDITARQRLGGTRMFEPYWQSNLAESLLVCGRHSQALKVARKALRESALTHNQYWDACLWQVVGDCLKSGARRADRALRAYDTAVAIAQRQGALQLAFRAASAKCEILASDDAIAQREAFRFKLTSPSC